MPGIDSHTNNGQKPEANCRSCTDFKSWAKVQRSKIGGTTDQTVRVQMFVSLGPITQFHCVLYF